MNPLNTESQTDVRYVTTAQVAQALGISVTTVKRWVDEGLLPAQRTLGGHRKLLMSDVLRLARDGQIPHTDASKLLNKSSLDYQDIAVANVHLIEAIMMANTTGIRNIIHGAYQAGIQIETIADRMIAPAMSKLGHDWELGRIEVMHEHRVTQACIAALYELTAFIRMNADRDRPVAVGGSPEHDHYILPSLLAKLTMIDSGWDAINLGPHTPMSAFRTAIDELNPQIIWITVTHLVDSEKFLQEYCDLYALCESKRVAVAIGGRALNEEIRTRMPYTTYGDGLTQLASFARSMHRRTARPKRGRPWNNTTKEANGSSREIDLNEMN